MTALTSLLISFAPAEWSEGDYVARPPFVVEKERGKILVRPRDERVASRIIPIAPRIGLKWSEGGRFLSSRTDTQQLFRDHDWLVRRSWGNADLRVLWALMHVCEKHGWERADVSPGEISDAAGLDPKVCREVLGRLFHADERDGRGLEDCLSDRRLVGQTLEKQLMLIPSWTEEVTMALLCSEEGKSVGEICDSLSELGVGAGAVYKVTGRLKAEGYLRPADHFRVNARGPMREMLATDCEKCFFGHTNQDMCVKETVDRLERRLTRDYGKAPTARQRAAMIASTKAVSGGSRANRRALMAIEAMREAERLAASPGVSTVIESLRRTYGVEVSEGISVR